MKWQGHPGVAEYLDRAGLEFDEVRADGGVTLVFDETCRVTIHAAMRGEAVFEAKLVALPGDRRACDDLLGQAARLASARLAPSPEMLVLADDDQALNLQRRVPAELERARVEVALEQFVDSVMNWRATLPGATV